MQKEGINIQFIANDYEPKDIFKILRNWTGLSQQEFADELCKGYRTIQAYEGGEIQYTLELLLRIAKQHNIELILKKDDFESKK